MVWPGLGAELVFEIYKSESDGEEERFVRILWGGEVLQSSYPALGRVDMLPLDTLLGYFDELVGVGAKKVPGLCNMPLSESENRVGEEGEGGKGGLDFCVNC